MAGAGTVVDGSVPTWTNDPYEYAWFSQQETDNTNVGVIIFNPRGYSQQVQTSTGVRTLSARVDYNIFDNHVIRDDRSMPSSGPYDVKLSLPFLLTSGDILKDQTTYNGIFRDSSGKSTAGDIYVYNANTGDEIMEIKGGVARLDSGLKPIGVKVDAITGTIRFNTDDVEKAGLQNVSLRLLYRTQKDWGMQVQKAHAHYVEALTAAAVDYKSYWVQEGGTRIYFPRSEAGKTVVLGEYFVNTINGIKHFSNEAYQINDNTALFVNGLTWIDLKSQHELEAVQENWFFPNDKDSPKGESVLNVQGASLKSRIVWAGSSDKTQDAKGNPVFKTRWRKLDTDTLLMQTPSQ